MSSVSFDTRPLPTSPPVDRHRSCSSRRTRPSDPTPVSPSIPSFPLFSRIVSLSFSSSSPSTSKSTTTTTTTTTTGKTRERRISLGGLVGGGKSKLVDNSSNSSTNLKRSKSARSSLIGISTRPMSFSSSTPRSPLTFDSRARRSSSARDFPPISRPIPHDRLEDQDNPGSFMTDYKAKAAAFTMSSPELVRRDGSIDEVMNRDEPQWAAWNAPQDGVSCDKGRREEMRGEMSPMSPMVKWSGVLDSSSFVPLTPTSPRLPPQDVSSNDSTATPEVKESTSNRERSSTSLRDSMSIEELVHRTTSISPPIDEEVRRINREEALARLTSPTPTNSKFPDSEFNSFPFPQVATPSLESAPPARPSRPPPPLPCSTSAHSLIVTSPTTPLGPPPLTRSNTVSLHPSPSVALDIDFRGRLVRARNSHSTPPVALRSSPSAGSTSSLSNAGISPPSSRFTEWSSRRSSDTSLSSSAHSPQTDPPKVTPVATSPAVQPSLYTDRRHAESAVDVLAIVEEDEAPFAIPSKHGGRRPGVVKRSDTKSSVSPQRRSSTSAKRISLDSALASSPSRSQKDVLILPRQRTRSPVNASLAHPPRPLRMSETNRTVSSGVVVEPTRSEKEEFGSRFSITTGARPTMKGGKVNFVDSPTPRSSRPPSDSPVPFPSSTLASASRAASPSSRKPHKRAISDLHIDQSLARSTSPVTPLDGLGIGLGLPPLRSRHESLAPDVDETAEALTRRASRRASGQAVRTKLVIREKGKPVLTYQLGECIGRGQFGTVYRALDLQTGSVVAVKRIQLEGKTEAEIEQLSNEVGLLQRLNHPAIVRYQGLLRSENYLNIILEYAESGSLQTTLRQFGQLPEGLVASYVVKILEGLAYLHEQGVVHCDLKAANILSTKTGNTKLSDFGVSLNLHAIKNTQGFGAGAKDVQGTPNWMAPEVISMNGALPASDIWSLGCTICELIDGRPPYADLVAMSAMFRIVEDENGPPVPPQCSDELKAFLARCFRKNPSERPTAEELFEDPWLLKNFDHRQDLRSQDSLPFLRRISGDYQRSRPSLDLPRPSSPPYRIEEMLSDATSSLAPPSPPFVSDDSAAKRESLDSGYIAGEDKPATPKTSTIRHAIEESPRPHDWIRSSFSRAVDCKLCGEQTKRHAVLCSRCGLVSHRRCTEFAPTCDLRGQLLGQVKIPLYPAATFSSTSPSPSGFSFADYLPGFGKARRPRATPTSSDQSVSPLSPTATTGKTSTAIRHLSSMLPTKPRTPDHTPPSSLGRINNGFMTRNRSSTTVASAERRKENASGSSIVHVAADDLLPSSSNTPPHAGPLRRKLSNNIVVQSAMSARLGKKKSHSRAQSQPVNKVKNEGDCLIM